MPRATRRLSPGAWRRVAEEGAPRKRKQRGGSSPTPRERMERGYARAEERNQEARENLQKALLELKKKYPFIREVRGEGLIIGVELSIEGTPFVAEAMRRGLLINCTHEFTLRLLPPFIVTKTQVREFLRALEVILASNPKSESAPVAPRKENTPQMAHSAAR